MTKNYLIFKKDADNIYQVLKESSKFEYLEERSSFSLADKDIEVKIVSYNERLSFLTIYIKLKTNRKREEDDAEKRLDNFTNTLFIENLKSKFLEITFDEKDILSKLDKTSIVSKAISF